MKLLTKNEFLLDIYQATVLECSKTCQNGDFIFLYVCNKYGTKIAKQAREFFNPSDNDSNITGFLDVVYKKITTDVKSKVNTWGLNKCAIYLSLFNMEVQGNDTFHADPTTLSLVIDRTCNLIDGITET